MCLITYAPGGKLQLDWDVLDYSARTMNDDGFGVAWYNEETNLWEVMQSMRSDKLRRAVAKIPDQWAPIVVHQRFATHGAKNMANCHPFPIGTTGALLFHNGTISGTRASAKSDINDTRAYIEDELAPLVEAIGHEWLAEPKVMDSIGSRVGGSVLGLALPNMPELILVNEWLGEWVGNLYYSNEYSRPSYKWAKYGSTYYTKDDADRYAKAGWSVKNWGDDDRYEVDADHSYVQDGREAFPDYEPKTLIGSRSPEEIEMDRAWLDSLDDEDDRDFARKVVNGYY